LKVFSQSRPLVLYFTVKFIYLSFTLQCGEEKMKVERNWTTITLRKDLVERVRKVVNSGMGYRSIADFVAEATRRRLEEVEPLLEKLPKASARLPAEANAEQREPTRANVARQAGAGGESEPWEPPQHV